MTSTVPRLRLASITKRYGALVANDAVSLQVAAGEIHAVLGENGAGKSTLIHVVGGLVRPDAGTIEIDGQSVTLRSPRDAARQGIALVHQHLALFDALTVAENLALAEPGARADARFIAQITQRAAELGLSVEPLAHVHDLSLGERQRIEVLRALLRPPRVLILDEPTSVLAPTEIDALFTTLRTVAAAGTAVIFVSHKLAEVRQLSARCTVLRAGRVVATVDVAATDEDALARLMLGGEPPALATTRAAPGRVVLEAMVDGAPIQLRERQIVGIAGIGGNGQGELLRRLSGEVTGAPDSVRLDGVAIGALSPRARRARGLRFVPEDRLGHGAVPSLTLARNLLLTHDALWRGGLLNVRALQSQTERVITRFDVRGGAPTAAAARLSGGNLQKFLIGRELSAAPRVLLVHQPTWGVDVGAAVAIRNALLALRDAGCALLLASEELDELFMLCDVLHVMAGGRLSPPIDVAQASLAQVGRWMSGDWQTVGEAA